MALTFQPASTTTVRARGLGLRVDPWLICAGLLALLPALALLRPGMPHTADGQVHLLRTYEVTQLLRAGALYPRWAPDLYLGYGYPFFNFYAPGAHLAAGALALAGLGVVGGVIALQVMALVLYPIGAYLAAREILPAGSGAGPAALVTAALYLFAPLRFRELFVQGNLSQWLALGLLPWCAWLVAGLAVRGGPLRMAGAAALLAALLYAHHPSAFLAWPQLFTYGVAVVFLSSARRGAKLGLVVAAFGLAAALAAPFWLPSILELRDANLNAIASGSFGAALNLLPLSELLALPAVQDLGALNPPMPNSLGVAQAVLAAAGFLVALAWTIGRGPAYLAEATKNWGNAGDPAERANSADKGDGGRGNPAPTADDAGRDSATMARGGWGRRQAGGLLLVAGAMLLGCLALMLPPAAPAWDVLPLGRFIAFPWRLLGPALLWAGLLGGPALYWLPGRARVPGLAISLVLIPLAVAPYLFPRPFGPVREPSNAEVARYELGGGALGTASANEYLPRWVQNASPPKEMAQQMLSGQPPARLDQDSLPAGSRATTLTAKTLEDRFQLDLPADAAVVIRRFYFPGWQATIDGASATLTAADPYGLIQVPVPAGRHELRVSWGTTPARQGAAALGLAGLVGIVLGTGAGLRLRRRAARTHAAEKGREPGLGIGGNGGAWGQSTGLRPALAAGGVILLLAVLTYGIIEPGTFWFRRQSPSDRPAGMQHAVHARFANGIELLGYDLPQPAAVQGGTLPVRLYWRRWRDDVTNARPLLHLDAVNEDLTWANQTKLNAGDKPMTAWPAGFFVVDDYQIPIPADAPPVVTRLRAGLLDAQGALVPVEGGQELAGLGTAWVTERTPPAAAQVPHHEQPYRFGPAIHLVGYQVEPRPDGQALEATLYWRADAPVPEDYTVFVHLLDAGGQVVAQADSPPAGGRYPTSAWLAGQVVADRHTIPLPAGTDPWQLQVRVGLYTPAHGQRAPASDAAGTRLANDEVMLPLAR